MTMGDQDYNSYLAHCERITIMLSQGIDTMMHYIFEGRSRNHLEWENLFKALNQAVFMKQYLSINCSNLLTISEDFMAQFQEWQQELQANLK